YNARNRLESGPTNGGQYRAHIKSVPEAAIPDVLVRLGRAAAEIRKLPGQTPSPLASYQQLYDTLHQLGRLDDVLGGDAHKGS
ncbi:MAG TPA: hypothetical protein PK539_00585, partial [Candidatus Paceibacterota bacterium]|nr:hypothetical protein [Candidatus Paceibacterota bacterium]